jgi:hypothetical protein
VLKAQVLTRLLTLVQVGDDGSVMMVPENLLAFVDEVK